MAAIELLKYMYCQNYACERDIFKTVSPIDFKLEICFHIIYRTDAIDFGPPANTKMVAIGIYKSDYSLRCEHDTSSTISLIDSNFEILSYVIKKTNDINIGLIS